VTLVGYTNAGKSSMLNAITDAGVEAEDRLFVTLDPRTRQRQLSGGETVLFTDTVGFISNLPHDLVDAFMSHAEVGPVGRPLGPRRRRIERSRRGTDRRGARSIASRSTPTTYRNFWSSIRPTCRARAHVIGEDATKAASGSRPKTHENLDEVIGDDGRSTALTRSCGHLQLPLDRGDLLAAAHREGEVVDTSMNDDSVVVHVYCSIQRERGRTSSEWRVPA
jgi:GTP-binding protein HflX